MDYDLHIILTVDALAERGFTATSCSHADLIIKSDIDLIRVLLQQKPPRSQLLTGITSGENYYGNGRTLSFEV
jgi:hypothetical protein